jgi:hypothetical protein
MYFEILGEITEIERIAAGTSIREVAQLRKRYGHGRWRKLKVLPSSGLLVIGYERLNCTGTKLMA